MATLENEHEHERLIAQQYEVVSVDELTTHPDNPRRGDVDKIKSSIDVNGFYGSVIAQRSTRHVLAGNHRLIAARALGIPVLPVIWVDVDDDRARRILAVDNRSNDIASYDDDELIALLTSFDGELDGTGFTDDDLRKLLGNDDSSRDDDMELGAQSLSIIVECDSEEQQSSLLERFEGEGLVCRPLMM